MARVDRTPQGIGPVDARFVEGALSSTLSSYTESGPRPGPAVASNAKQNASPVLSGAQSVGADLKVSKSGDPSIERRGAAYMYKLDTDASADAYRGWASPVMCSRAATVHFSTTAAITSLDACVSRDDQSLTCIFAEGATTSLSWRRLTESGQALTSAATVDGGAGSMRGPATITALPDGRLLLLDFFGPANLQGPTSYVQTPPSTPWAELSDDPFPGGTSWVSGAVSSLWMRYARGQVILLATDTGGRLHQFASADLGSSFRFVETIANVAPQGVGVDVFPDGSILVAYNSTSEDTVYARRLGSAFEPVSEAASVELDPATSSTSDVVLTASIDADGTAYVVSYDLATQGAANNYLQIFASSDGGINWTKYTDGPIGSLELGNWAILRSACSMGRLYVFGALENTTSGVTMFTLSGWSNVTPGPTHTSASRNGYAGLFGGTAGAVGMWWAAAVPAAGNTGYQPFSTGAGVLAGSSDDQYLEVTTTSAGRFFRGNQAASIVNGADAAVSWSCQLVSGGGLSAINCGVNLRHTDASGDEINLSVRLITGASDQVRLTDGTTSVNVTTPTSTRRDWLLELQGTGATARLYVRDDPSEVWTLLATIAGVATGSAATVHRTIWGHLTASSTVSRWWWVAHRHSGMTIRRSHGAGISDQIGKRIAGTPYPLPDVGSATAASFARLVGGHNRPIGTPDFNADPAFDYPVGAVFPGSSPSPSATWRTSADGVDTDLVVELSPGIDTRLDEALPVVVVRNANFDRLEVATGDATPTYTTVGTLDLRFPAVNFTRSGDAVSIAGAPGSVTRWLHADEMVGGYLDFGSGVRCRILSHTAGYMANTATVKPVFRIDDSGSAPASGSMTPIHHSGILVLSGYTPASARYWRLRIPSQQTAENYYEAGTISLGAILVPGKRWADGFTFAVEPIVSSSDSQSGTRRIEERGTPRRRLTVSWSHGSKIDRLRGNASQVDHLSAGPSTPALAGRDDVLWQLEALQGRAQSGRLPVVVVPQIPTQTSTITDPSLYLFGVVEGTVQAAQVVGDEGVDEYVRVESLTVTELV